MSKIAMSSRNNTKKTNKFKNTLLLMVLIPTGILVSGCNDHHNSSNNLGQLTQQTCWHESLVTMKASCGTLTVPQDYNENNTLSRQVGYAILPALNAKTTPDKLPIVNLIGGPGPSGTGIHAVDFNVGGHMAFLRKNRKVILIDYRGVGSSEPALSCPPPSDAVTASHCNEVVKNSPLEFTEMRSAVFARDVDLLLASLNYSQALLYGGSYGTRLALTILRDTPNRIVGAILDGVFPVEVNGFSQSAVAPLAGLNAIVERCNNSEDCVRELGDMRAQIETMVAKWHSATSIDSEKRQNALVSLARLAYHPATPFLVSILNMVSAEDSIEQLLAFKELEYTDGNLGELPIPNFPESLWPRNDSTPMTLSIICSEEEPFTSSQTLETSPSYPYGFSNTVTDIVRNFSGGAPIDTPTAKTVCANFDAPAASTLETEAVFSNVPTLLLNGGMDMQTSFAWGEQTAKNLTNSTTVLIPLSDHITVSQSECAQSIATQFMDDPNSILDTSCATDLLKPVITTSSDLEAEFTP